MEQFVGKQSIGWIRQVALGCQRRAGFNSDRPRQEIMASFQEPKREFGSGV